MKDFIKKEVNAPWQKEIANIDASGMEVARNPYPVILVEPIFGNKKAQKLL